MVPEKTRKQKENQMVRKVEKLEEIMSEYLSHWEWSESKKFMTAIDYAVKFGAKDMEAFIKFCKENDMEEDITPTIAHDINGMYSDCFLPRTSGYYARTKMHPNYK